MSMIFPIELKLYKCFSSSGAIDKSNQPDHMFTFLNLRFFSNGTVHETTIWSKQNNPNVFGNDIIKEWW